MECDKEDPGLAFDLHTSSCKPWFDVDTCGSKTQEPMARLDVADECQEGRNPIESFKCAKANLNMDLCFPAESLCDGHGDCDDGSDENVVNCLPVNDPWAANPNPCLARGPSCNHSVFESPVSWVMPERHDIPQFVMITFTGSVKPEFRTVFELVLRRLDQIRVTFFAYHMGTDYHLLHELYESGHEIGISTVTGNVNELYWSEARLVEEHWFNELHDLQNVLGQFALIPLDDIRGVRAPYLSVGGNAQMKIAQELNLKWDSSIVVPMEKKDYTPVWPYSLKYKIPHECGNEEGICPFR